MKLKNLVILSISVMAMPMCSPAGDPPEDGKWESLFDGKDLSGWTLQNGGAFTVTNGMIHLAGGTGWLRTDREYGDFVLEVEWRGLGTNFNSGIFVRAPLDGKPWATNIWQVNLKSSAVGELLAGNTREVHSTTARAVNQWTHFRIEAMGKTLRLSIDGAPAWEFKDVDPVRGYIGLQAEGWVIDFRNLRLKALP